jgi:hypothetical protein
MAKNKYTVPVAREVRFEIVAYQRLYLRKKVQVVTGQGEVADVDVAIDMTLGEWDKLRKKIKKARNRKQERTAHKMLAITRRRPVTTVPLPDVDPEPDKPAAKADPPPARTRTRKRAGAARP